MKVIFGTTNKRKIYDLQDVIDELNLGIQILSMDDIGWNLGEIEEVGKSIEENSLIKASAIFSFCKEKGIEYPIVTDDSGLFCNGLDGEPGIYTARYADIELKKDSNLPKYQCVIKLLKKLENIDDRSAYYKCCVTCMMPDGTYFQEYGESKGMIAREIIGKLERPYFYSVFILNGCCKVFSELKEEELLDTYRYQALKKVLNKVGI